MEKNLKMYVQSLCSNLWEHIQSHYSHVKISLSVIFIKNRNTICIIPVPVQSLSHVRLFATPWIAARQASLSITNSQSSLKLMSIESVMPSSHLILCHPLILPQFAFPPTVYKGSLFFTSSPAVIIYRIFKILFY